MRPGTNSLTAKQWIDTRPTIPFGQFKGSPYWMLPTSYLRWVDRQCYNKTPDVRDDIGFELNTRDADHGKKTEACDEVRKKIAACGLLAGEPECDLEPMLDRLLKDLAVLCHEQDEADRLWWRRHFAAKERACLSSA